MYYTIYRTTCIINGKSYIGKHKTTNLADSYLGSGSNLLKDIKLHGSENFYKEILGIYPSVEAMNLAERIFVVIDKELFYNIYPGGGGDWSYINNSGIAKFRGRKHTAISKEKISKAASVQLRSEEFKEKRRYILSSKPTKHKVKQTRKGTSKSEIHKKNLSLALKKYYAGLV